MIKFLLISGLLFLSTACLRTRSEVSPNEQSYIARKNSEAQKNESNLEHNKSEGAKLSAQEAAAQEDLIRTLNGRIEVLENQLSQMKSEQSQNQSAVEAQKLAALQEALTKMELQIQKLESGQAAVPAPAPKSSDANEAASGSKVPEGTKASDNVKADDNADMKKSDYDVAEALFAQKEWKKSILSYQKFVDKFPKSKLVPDAKYKTGVCFQELGMIEEAKAFYEETSVQFPQTLAGKKSKIRLASLNPKTGSHSNSDVKPKKK